tara:strand:+ start:1054 stop:1596 length:543 start_codon:yes stop_codon:yes gene_type:complete
MNQTVQNTQSQPHNNGNNSVESRTKNEYTLFIKPEESVVEFYSGHHTYHAGDSGLDLFTPFDVEFKPHELGKIVDLKISCEFYDTEKCSLHHQYKSYYLYPRSSLSKTPLRMANSVGIIDAGYRGNILMSLDNRSSEKYTLLRGTRLVQLCAGDLAPFKMKVVSELSNTTRGVGGFGSTT